MELDNVQLDPLPRVRFVLFRTLWCTGLDDVYADGSVRDDAGPRVCLHRWKPPRRHPPGYTTSYRTMQSLRSSSSCTTPCGRRSPSRTCGSPRASTTCGRRRRVSVRTTTLTRFRSSSRTTMRWRSTTTAISTVCLSTSWKWLLIGAACDIGKWDHIMDQTHVMYYYWQNPMMNTYVSHRNTLVLMF